MYVVDASGRTLGRLASRVAAILRGKHKPTFTLTLTPETIIIVNADRIVLTGNKLRDKIYTPHSAPGGLRAMTYGQFLAKSPEKLVERAVRGMLPKNRLGRSMIKKLKVYASADHPHQAQKPEVLEV